MPYKQGKKWRAKVTWEGRRYTALKDTKRKAREWEQNKVKELKIGQTKENFMGLGILSIKYLDYSKLHHSRTVYNEKKRVCKRLLETIGDVFCKDLTGEILMNYLNTQAIERSANASNKDRRNLMAMFNYGVAILGLQNNPVLMIPKMPHDRAPQCVPSTADVLKVLAVATREEKVLLDCYLNTGARKSEIFRWTWHEDINFDQRQVRLGTRKNRTGSMEYEWIPMNDVLYESLWWWWHNRPIKNSPFVFVCDHPSHWFGQPFVQRRDFITRLCERAKVAPFGFHSLRRYVASYLADVQKVSAKTIQRVLRHKEVRTTERYIKQLNADMKDTYQMIEGIYEKQKGTKKGTKQKGDEP